MNCFQFEDIFHDLDRPGTEGFALRDAALAHAESCSQCGQLLTQAESLDLAFRTLSSARGSEQAPPRLERLLRDEFRRGKAASSRRGVRLQISALGTAAAMLLALGLSLRHLGRTTAGPGKGQRGTPALVSGNSANAATAGVPGVDSGSSDATPAESQTTDSDSETAFVPLPYADDSMTTDCGAIVRVVLSRPELASLGLPVTDMASTDRIPADIIVGEDGAPQAIRLVSEARLDDEFIGQY